ncbi:IS110 family transposase [Actinospica robiniae]|uniref:IS110 family transposase n=1 Tax=Actinospica robiniae TaxID=304901 RepID=UPI00068833AE
MALIFSKFEPITRAWPRLSLRKRSFVRQARRHPTGAGIDTYTELHQAAVIETIGWHLATEAFPSTPAGYRRLLTWLRSHGQVIAVGMEGTGSFGAELARYLRAHHVTVIEVDRPDRRARRAAGNSDPVDAYAADRSVGTKVSSGRAHCGSGVSPIAIARVRVKTTIASSVPR